MIAFFCIRSFRDSAPVTEESKAVSNEKTKYIALTFDDGPNTSTTNQVLDILEEYNAKASFFLIGENINARSEKSVKRAFDMGCEINNHSMTHSDMAEMSERDIRAEIESVNEQIFDIIGTYPSFFRPPYISVSDTMYAAIDIPFISGAGCDDWMDDVSAEERAEKVLSKAQNGQIILMHDAEGNRQTVKALKTIVPELQKQGYELVTLTELFEVQGVKPDEDTMYSIVERYGQ
ncbi:MAG: polysaccharide deacetylase family protein [Oscillospiraceae bacterium]|nr:polysaccharide deacetylase family protein [Oscillospiraceae bacterium]